jgi:hypothetical protein
MVGVKNDSLISWEIGMEQSIFHLSFWAFGRLGVALKGWSWCWRGGCIFSSCSFLLLLLISLLFSVVWLEHGFSLVCMGMVASFSVPLSVSHIWVLGLHL